MALLGAMIAVGGLSEFAAGNRARLVRFDKQTGKQKEYGLRINDLLRKGDTRANVMLMPGDIRAGLYTVWSRRWIALGVAWVVCLAGWLAVGMIPNKYESHARIFVRIDDVLSDQIGLGADRHRDVDRVRQTLTSAVNLEKVVRATAYAGTVPFELHIHKKTVTGTFNNHPVDFDLAEVKAMGIDTTNCSLA
eukprot:gene14575-18445_t